MKKIIPFLWFDKNLKEITDFYMSVFPEAKLKISRPLSDTPSGEVETATMEIFGQELGMMTAGPMFKFTEAISFMVNCENQEEIDYYWNALTSNGGQEGQCGWCKDKYGLSWQVIPATLEKMLTEGTKEQSMKVTQAYMKMKKFDFKAVEEAFNS